MGVLSSKGNISPARPVVIVWGTLTGAAAAIALLADGLSGLQTAPILSAAPFVPIMIGLCFSIFKALRGEWLPREAPGPERARTRPTGAPAPQQARAVEPESRG
jgi:glycine betaine transporter